MSWFVRKEKGIHTPTEMKREVPDGLWYKCPECKNVTPVREHKLNAYTCPHCNYHDKIGSEVYFELLFDDNKFKELSPNMRSADPLGFVDTKPYPVRIATSIEKTGRSEEHTSELQSRENLVCRLLLEK